MSRLRHFAGLEGEVRSFAHLLELGVPELGLRESVYVLDGAQRSGTGAVSPGLENVEQGVPNHSARIRPPSNSARRVSQSESEDKS